MQIVRPNEFASAFARAVKNREKQIGALWYPWKARAYTSLFLNDKDCILREVAGQFHLKFQGPWWTLDGIFYEEVDNVHFPKGWEMAKYLSVAIEHENSSSRAPYQTNKLSIFNAPLKVLITYAGRPGKRGEDKREALLEQCSRVVQGADALEDFSSRRKQLVILGSDEGGGAGASSAVLKWCYYVYEHGKLVEITP